MTTKPHNEAAETLVAEPKYSIAQRCLMADNPLLEARKQQGYKGHPEQDVLRFHFEGNSCLDFKIEYTPIAAGRIFEDE